MSAFGSFRRLSCWIIQFCIAAMVLELCARTDDWLRWRAPIWGDYREEMLFINDALGYHLRPSSKYQKWRINRFGFRGPEISLEKPPGVVRIVTIGASETFGLYEKEGMEFPAQLQSLLDQARRGKYQVLNAAIPGISMNRIVHYYEAWLTKFRPDIVVLYPNAAFMLDAEDSATSWQPGVQKSDESFRLASRLAGKLRELLKQVIPQFAQTTIRKFLISYAVKTHPSSWVLGNVPPDKVAAFENELRVFVSVVRGSGAAVVLATHANRIDGLDTAEERTLMIAWRKQAPHLSETCLLESEKLANSVIRRLGQREYIPVVDIAALIPKSSRYFADYQHFTDEGAAATATLLAPVVLELSMRSVPTDGTRFCGLDE